MTKILILLSLTSFGCSTTPQLWKCNGDPVHVCPAAGHGPCPFCSEVSQ